MKWQRLPLAEATEPLTSLAAALERAQRLRFHQHPRWLAAANRALFDDGLDLLLASDTDDRVQLAVPVGQAGVLGLTPSPMHDHLSIGDVLVHPALAGDALDTALASLPAKLVGGSGLHFHNLAPDSRLLSLRESNAGNNPNRVWRPARESAFFDLAGGQSSPPGKLRRNLRRLRKRLVGDDRDRQLDSRFLAADETHAALARFFTLEATGWKGAEGSAIAMHPALQCFYESLAELPLRVGELWLDEQLIASEIGLVDDRGLNLLKVAYDENHSDCSPGSLLLEDTLAHAAAAGHAELSLVTSPAWAERWHPETATVWHLCCFQPGLQGSLLRRIDAFRQQIKRRLTG